MLKASAHFPRRRGREFERGVSIVELMVGVAIGLFLIAGAMSMFVSHLQGSRRLLIDARINQDLRTAADLIARDLRRAGFWANALSGTIATGSGTATTPNNYGTIATTGSSVTYDFAQDTDNTVQASEQFGFKLNGGVIEFRTDGAPTWRQMTDPSVLTVTAFTITVPPNMDVVPLGNLCASGCNTVPPPAPSASTAACPNPPALAIRRYDLLIQATASGDASIKRELKESVRIRNDRITGTCPA